MPLDHTVGCESSRPNRPVHGRRVLLAEDDNEMRTLLARALRAGGAQVEELATGGDLVARVRAFLGGNAPVPDIIVSDVRMPGASGLDVLRELRAQQSHVPVVLLTGFGAPELHDKVRALGRAVLFDKPFDLDELRDAVLHGAVVPGAADDTAP